MRLRESQFKGVDEPLLLRHFAVAAFETVGSSRLSHIESHLT